MTTPKLADGAVTNAKVNSGAASSDFVLAADGSGGANWTSPLSILPLVGAPYVLKSGDAMTGTLKLNADPTNSLHAATKQYVDVETTRAQGAETILTTNLNAEVTRATAAEGAKVAKAGDTMSGLLTLSGNPTAIFHAATKQYVDTETTRAILAEGTLTTNLTNEVSRATAAESTLTTIKVSKAGDTMTGALTLNADPMNALHAATKQYVDTAILGVPSNAIQNQTAAPQNASFNITGDATIGGNINLTGSIQTGPRLRYCSLPAATFVPADNTNGYLYTNSGAAVSTSSAGANFVAPIQLPDGATIKSFQAFMSVNGGIAQVRLASYTTAGVTSIIGSFNNTNAPPSSQVIGNTNLSVPINNQSNGYYVELSLVSGTSLRMVVIGYETSTLP